MKVGLILECGPQGADKAVCEHFTKLLDPKIQVVSLTLDNKPKLIEKCAVAAQTLFEIDGCDRVVIVWDLYPAWREAGEKPCVVEDRERILEKLKDGKVVGKVALVCIVEELEAWLLSEHQAISAVLSKPTRKVRVGKVKRPERTRNPKATLNRIFQENTGKPYSDLVHAGQIARLIADTNRLCQCETFVRFAREVADVEL